MCHYFETKIIYKACTNKPAKHINHKTQYDRCEKSLKEGYPCVDATPAKGLNGQIIQMGSTYT
ncbi:hypothetical protein CEP52_012825 [Fusarium oligoseptatum]|uniref:Uncharacterized protein n=2 Tax=Fusarium solani species complex TaxID=232080 RepID=A0A428SWF2_9HYPO|nr:hypothetical protein CEP52_012825 [Fusarium oligoseptatum]